MSETSVALDQLAEKIDHLEKAEDRRRPWWRLPSAWVAIMLAASAHAVAFIVYINSMANAVVSLEEDVKELEVNMQQHTTRPEEESKHLLLQNQIDSTNQRMDLHIDEAQREMTNLREDIKEVGKGVERTNNLLIELIQQDNRRIAP